MRVTGEYRRLSAERELLAQAVGRREFKRRVRVAPTLGLAIVHAVACTVGATAATAQQAQASPDVAPVFRALEGEWDGTGVLMNRPGAFHMLWQIEDDGFVRLSFSNAWVDEQGNRTPVLRSEAIYLTSGGTVQGVWIDSRPQRIRLDAIVSDTSLVTDWTADAETGRTEYVVVSPGEVIVRDWVEGEAGLRLFGEARYRRRERTPDR